MLSRVVRAASGPFVRGSGVRWLQYGHDMHKEMMTDTSKVSISEYDENGFVVNDVNMRGSIALFPTIAMMWKPNTMDEVTQASLSIFTVANPAIEILVLGCGSRISKRLDPTLVDYLKNHGIVVEYLDSFNACATFNILNAEDRKVAAAILVNEPNYIYAYIYHLEKPKAAVKRVHEEIDEQVQEEHVEIKKAKASSAEKLDDGSIAFDLSAKKQLTVRKWKNAVLVDIREYYDAGGVRKPGKKGISLTKEQYKKVETLVEDVDAAIIAMDDGVTGVYLNETLDNDDENSVAFAISPKRRITIRKFKGKMLVDIREFYDSDGSMKPGNKGISLTKEQWRVVVDKADEIAEAMASV
ncbi:hypothetical protein THRCLA_04092 [Thraustotheca clavata]|uniref:Transcriptional coactivator p15 (PC4) C-terminal domain-containing protein n=1 Tax=Thraustotheca clavata TaxID=74557 RepID=A0A1W0A078_9STRA|nr:hypothetical protein THRCLA_04092 [Thraustotheca clavata]